METQHLNASPADFKNSPVTLALHWIVRRMVQDWPVVYFALLTLLILITREQGFLFLAIGLTATLIIYTYLSRKISKGLTAYARNELGLPITSGSAAALALLPTITRRGNGRSADESLIKVGDEFVSHTSGSLPTFRIGSELPLLTRRCIGICFRPLSKRLISQAPLTLW